MSKTYKGKFTELKNPNKYVGKSDNIVYRSFWERCVFKWADENPNVVEWASEEIIIPYDHPIRGNRAKYYPDLFLKMSDGQIRLIEIKPKKETSAPEKPKRQTKNYINEVATFAINSEKWKAARVIAEKHGMTFEIWTEDTLNEMGILRSPKQSKDTLRAESAQTRKPKLKPVAKKRTRSYTKPKRRS